MSGERLTHVCAQNTTSRALGAWTGHGDKGSSSLEKNRRRDGGKICFHCTFLFELVP